MRLLLILFCLCLFCDAHAQSPAYIHYGVRDGLPGNLVYCGLQDHLGLLWFGTDKGLANFDGFRFRTFDLGDGLPDLEVLDMKEDSHGRIWLSCFRQKPCYFYNGRIYTDKQDSILSKIEFSSTAGSYNVSEDDHGNLWFFAGKREVFYTDWTTLHKTDFFWPIRLDKVGDDYMFFSEFSIDKRITNDSVIVVYKSNYPENLSSIAISQNKIVRSYNTKIELLEWRNNQITLLDSMNKNGGRFFTDRKGRFWLSTPYDGAICFDNDQQNFSNPVRFLPNKKLTSIFEDAQGTLWFCTLDEGVFGLPENAPINFQLDFFPSKNIRSLARCPNGNLLVGDDIGNVHILRHNDKKTISFGSIDGSNLIRQIIPNDENCFWAASDEGLYFYDRKTGHFIHFPRQESFKSILQQKDVIYFASSSNLGALSISNNIFTILIRKRFTALGTDADHNTWAGNMVGIFSQSDSFKINWGDRFPILKSRITAIREAGPGQIWVVTPENGLLRATVESGKIIKVEEINRLLKSPILNIQSICTEPNGDVWMATNKGIYGINKSYQVWHFDSHDGLADDDVNCIFIDQDTIWAGTVSGLSKITRNGLKESGNYKTFISNVVYQSNSATFTLHLLDSLTTHREIVLNSDAKNIELNLAGLDYRSRGNLHFDIEQNILLLPFYDWTVGNLAGWIAGRLGGLKNISHVESPSFSLGAYLPPGRYQIRVTAVNASAQPSNQPDTWVFLKQPHWYELIWFYLLILSLLVTGIRQYYKARIAYREASASAATLQLQALQGQMNPHFIGNSINAIQQFLHPPDPIKASEYISLFTRLLRRTMLFSEQTFIPFSEELLYCQEYFKMVQLRFEDKFNYEIIGADQIAPNTLIPSMLLQPFLENATIHGLAQEEDSHIELRFEMEQEMLRFTLTDNGLGFKETQRLKQLSGLKRESKGLEVLRKKIYALNRLYNLDLSLEIQDRSDAREAEHGTRVTLTFTPEKIWKAITAKPETSTSQR
ncbi:MAG: two-component regulator propeller domain-containing protein [Bacteroidota bacterium]